MEANDLVEVPDPLPSGTRLGPYDIVDVLGSGAVGVVYRARDPATGRLVALKACSHPSYVRSQSLRREVHALSRLEHPGVVRILAEGIADGVPWFAMELLEGRAGREWLAELDARRAAGDAAGALDDALVFIAKLCEPLAYIHQLGVVHGDLKPENIKLTAAGLPVLVDFGLHRRANNARGREGLEVGGALLGTACYMPPEQIWGELIDARADLYALGCVLHEAITGAPPFVGTLAEVFQQHLHAAPRRPSESVATIPEWLDVLVLQLLAKRRGDRLGYADLVARRIAAHGMGRSLPRPPAVRSYVYRPELVGRDQPVADLTTAVADACGGRGSFTVVVGESGIGKTRLAMEIGTIASRRGMAVVLGECEAGAGDTGALTRSALQPFRPLLAHIADLCRDAPPDVTDRLLGPRGPLLATYERALTTLPGQERYPPPKDVSAEATVERLTRAVCDTIVAVAAEEPLLLVLDDVQWADDLSFQVLDAMVTRGFGGAPVAILALCRAEDIDGPLRAIVDAPYAQVVRLERLGAPAVHSMVGDMLALAAPAVDFVEAIYAHTEGNPFYVSEYVLVAVEQQYLRRDETGAWRLAPPRELGHRDYTLPIPTTLRELLLFRLERLSDGARRVVEIGSAIGLAFEESLLLQAVDAPDLTVMEAIDELLHRQFLERERAGTLAFAHAKIREVTYDALEPRAQVTMHERAARAIETHYADPTALQGHYGALALHWSRVAAFRIEDRALRATALAALERAGDQAAERDDHQQAVRYFAEAVRLDGLDPLRTTPAPRRALWHRQLGDSHFRLGHMREARDDLTAALALAGAPMPTGAIATSAALLGAVAAQVRRRLGPHPGRATGAPANGLDQASTYDLLSFVQFLLMERVPSLVSSLRSLNRAEALAPSSALVNSSAMVGTVAGTLFGPQIARHYFGMALDTGRRLGDDLSLGRAAEMRGFYLIGQGDWAGAAASLQEAIAAFERIDDRPWRDIAVLTFANLQFMQYRPALAHYEDGLRGGIARGDAQCRTWAELGTAAELLHRGDNAGALALLDGGDGEPTLEARFAALSDLTSQLDATGTRSQALYRLGRHDAAIASVVAACELLPHAPLFRYDPLPGYVLTADVSARLWEAARPAGGERERQLAGLAEVAYRQLRAFSRFIRIAKPHAAIIHGLLLWTRGRQRRAHAEWQRAVRLAAALDMPYERALAHFEMGRHAVAEAERASHLDAALAGFERLDTRFECELARAEQVRCPSRPRSSSGSR